MMQSRSSCGDSQSAVQDWIASRFGLRTEYECRSAKAVVVLLVALDTEWRNAPVREQPNQSNI